MAQRWALVNKSQSKCTIAVPDWARVLSNLQSDGEISSSSRTGKLLLLARLIPQSGIRVLEELKPGGMKRNNNREPSSNSQSASCHSKLDWHVLSSSLEPWPHPQRIRTICRTGMATPPGEAAVWGSIINAAINALIFVLDKRVVKVSLPPWLSGAPHQPQENQPDWSCS